VEAARAPAPTSRPIPVFHAAPVVHPPVKQESVDEELLAVQLASVKMNIADSSRQRLVAVLKEKSDMYQAQAQAHRELEVLDAELKGVMGRLEQELVRLTPHSRTQPRTVSCCLTFLTLGSADECHPKHT
jgi:hypothetical protein